jgi:hypothetical protein
MLEKLKIQFQDSDALDGRGVKKLVTIVEAKEKWLPRILVISSDVWTQKPKEGDDPNWIWFLNQTSGSLAFFWTSGNIIFVREDALTKRILFHEFGHWAIHKWLHSVYNLHAWWDEHSPFVWHMASIAVKVGLLKIDWRKEKFR